MPRSITQTRSAFPYRVSIAVTISSTTVEESDAAGNVKWTWFHQDSVRRGKVAASEFVDASGVNSTTYNTWQCRRWGQ